MTASVILGACLPQKPPASTARPNPYTPGKRSAAGGFYRLRVRFQSRRRGLSQTSFLGLSSDGVYRRDRRLRAALHPYASTDSSGQFKRSPPRPNSNGPQDRHAGVQSSTPIDAVHSGVCTWLGGGPKCRRCATSPKRSRPGGPHPEAGQSFIKCGVGSIDDQRPPLVGLNMRKALPPLSTITCLAAPRMCRTSRGTNKCPETSCTSSMSSWNPRLDAIGEGTVTPNTSRGFPCDQGNRYPVNTATTIAARNPHCTPRAAALSRNA